MLDFTNPNNIITYLLDKDYENKLCAECRGPMPTFVSINNAIIICENCASKHKELGYNISYIRGLNDDWDQYLLTYLERGGNSRYIRLSQNYNINNIPVEQKLKTKILEYYRLLLKSEVLADEPPVEIEKEIATQPSVCDKIVFPEFENYEIYKGNMKIEKTEGGLIGAFRYVGSGLGSMANYLKDKYIEYEITSKIKTGITVAGNYIYNASKPVVKYASDKTVQGIGYIYNKINENIKGVSSNDKGEKDENNIKINNAFDNNNVQHSSLIFEKSKDLDVENEQNSESNIQEYPSLSTINKATNNNNNINNNSNINDSAAPLGENIISLKKEEEK